MLVFKSLRPKKIFVIDFDSKFGEIAAAKVWAYQLMIFNMGLSGAMIRPLLVGKFC